MRERTSSVSPFIHTLPKWEGLDKGQSTHQNKSSSYQPTNVHHPSVARWCYEPLSTFASCSEEGASVSREKEVGVRSQGKRMVPRTDIGVVYHMKDKW